MNRRRRHRGRHRGRRFLTEHETSSIRMQFARHKNQRSKNLGKRCALEVLTGTYRGICLCFDIARSAREAYLIVICNGQRSIKTLPSNVQSEKRHVLYSAIMGKTLVYIPRHDISRSGGVFGSDVTRRSSGKVGLGSIHFTY